MFQSTARRAGLVGIGLCLLGILVTGCFLLPNQPPVADFSAIFGVVEGDDLIVDLDARTSSDPDGDAITTYMWVIDDDDATILSPLAVSKTVTQPILRVAFADRYPHEMQILVIDERGAASEPIQHTVTIPSTVSPTQ